MPIFGAKSRAMRGCASKLACGHRIGPCGSYEFAKDFCKNSAFCRADVGIGPYDAFKDSVGIFELVLVSQERFKKTESVFFRRSKRKSCTAVANSEKTFSLTAGSFNNPPASDTAPAGARYTRPAFGLSLRASAGRFPVCACPVRPPEAFRSGCAPCSVKSLCHDN